VAAALAASAALADGTMTITPSAHGTIVSPTEARLTVAVRCAIDNQTDGNVTVMLTQTSGSKATTASGSIVAVCDGILRAYQVSVNAADGRWHNDPATFAATGQADGYRTVEACYTDSDGVQHCTIATSFERDTGAVEVPIALENG
jgi:hypothetical protein